MLLAPGTHAVGIVGAVEVFSSAVLLEPFFPGVDPAGLYACWQRTVAMAFADSRIDDKALATVGAAPDLIAVMFFHHVFLARLFPGLAMQQTRTIGSCSYPTEYGLMGRVCRLVIRRQAPLAESRG